ncbi:MAG TPA: single-stranded-DNA-specific exonuclease RecJ [Anaerolineae bacterium]|nr:single-stranded-DNA-specific exonuclease RecJ [Anaerolineae bacterium]
MKKRWTLPIPLPTDIDRELSELRPIEREILFNRGIRTRGEANVYFASDSLSDFDPFHMTGMERAVERLSSAIRNEEHIVIYGDYDADGITATSLLFEVLKKVGASVGYYIPDRFEEGYGVNREALAKIKQEGAQLVVTVDCGIRAIDHVEYARSIGLDVIVTDHHEPGQDLPNAVAVVNPKQLQDSYPFEDLAGVGVAYKLAHALLQSLGKQEPIECLDLVAIGTVADLSPLVGENRNLVRRGLDKLNHTERVGLRALIEVSGYELGNINTTSIGFGLAPRLNAVCRLESADPALQLLTSNDELEVMKIARYLDDMNRKRQRLTSKILEEARSLSVGEDPMPFLIAAVDPNFNEGIVGLVAARLVEEFYRPSIVATYGEHFTRASARSIPEFHITEALDHCADLLERYGGHAVAAGFFLRNDNLDAFLERLRGLAESELSGIELSPILYVDARVQLSDLDGELIEFVERMEPCGQGNPLPVFAAEDLTVVDKRSVGSGGRHLKLTVRDELRVFDAIAFRQGHLCETLPQRVDVAFHFERNDYRGIPSLQLNVLDIREAGSFRDPKLTVWER